VIQQVLGFFSYFFANPSVLGWGLAVIFTAIWLACYRPPLLSKPWLWVVLVVGAILAPVAMVITFFLVGPGIFKLYSLLWSPEVIQQFAWLVSIPSIFIVGLVWEGAKLVPVGVYWWRKNRKIEPKLGLLIGAVAGAGFGLLQAQWTINYFIRETNWNWQLAQIEGFPAMIGFWESFFILGLNVASTALAGWGVAKGWGWKFYLLAGFVYLVTNYNIVLASYELVSATQAQFLIATWALIVVGVTLWLREKKSEVSPKK